MGEQLRDMLARLPKSFDLGEISRGARFGLVWQILSNVEPPKALMWKVSWRCRKGRFLLPTFLLSPLGRQWSAGGFLQATKSSQQCREPVLQWYPLATGPPLAPRGQYPSGSPGRPHSQPGLLFIQLNNASSFCGTTKGFRAFRR